MEYIKLEELALAQPAKRYSSSGKLLFLQINGEIF